MSTYVLSVSPNVLDHGIGTSAVPAWFADFATPDEPEIREYNITDAMAASGDYFITLATRLDKMAQGLPQDSAEQIELEHIVQTLFYLQDHWSLVSK
jgi:hypothetical protein